MEKNVEISLLLSFYKNMLTERQADTVELYYNEDLSLSEVGAELGISRQGVRDNLKRAEAILYDVESKLGEIDDIIAEIEKSPEARLLPVSIKKQINQILTIVTGINDLEE